MDKLSEEEAKEKVLEYFLNEILFIVQKTNKHKDEQTIIGQAFYNFFCERFNDSFYQSNDEIKADILTLLNPNKWTNKEHEINEIIKQINDNNLLLFLLLSLVMATLYLKLDVRDRKKAHREKDKFYSKRDKVICLLKELSYDDNFIKEIEKKEFEKDDDRYRNFNIRKQKFITRETIIKAFGLGKNKTNEIMKLFDYIILTKPTKKSQ